MRKQFAVVTAALAVLLSSVALVSPSASGADEAIDSAVPTTPLLSARRFPHSLQAAAADPKFAAVLDPYMAKAAGSTCAVVMDAGRVVYARGATDTLAPASVQKLLTATAALDILGPDTRLSTVMAAAKAPENGVVNGDLFLIGGGDPLLTTAGYRTSLEDPDQFTEDFNLVADALAQAGVKEITGGIVGDDSRYESLRWLPGWPTRYQIGGTVAPLSALLVNDGQSGFTQTPTVANPNRRAGDPTLLAAETFKTLLLSRGIKVSGPATSGTAPDGAVRVASYESATVTEIVNEMLFDSDNTTAELLTREMGFVTSGRGTTAAGLEAIAESIGKLDLPSADFRMSDGSGLDPENRMSCAVALALITNAPRGSIIANALPVAGKSGTLRKRMLSTASTGRVQAKTGTLNTANALAGFADTPLGNRLTFAMIQNGSDPRGPGFADGFADRLMTYADAPKLSLLGPVITAR